MKSNKLKTRFVFNLIKSILFALLIFFVLCIIMIFASASRPFAIFFYDNLFTFMLMFTTIFIFAFFSAFLYLVKQDISRINEINKALIEISEGKFNQKLRVETSDEIGAMANIVNYMTEKLDKIKEDERKLEQTRKNLITNASHDLRTPLTSVLGYLDLIINHKYDDEETLESYAKTAHSKCTNLKILIDELFEYSRLESLEVSAKRKEININELLEQVLVSFVVEFQKANLTYNFSHPNGKVMVDIDPHLYNRVFENLLSNAIAYADANTNIDISIAPNEDNIEVQFKNFNQQITQEECGHLFERNYRPQHNNKSGTGLGLCIVKQIINLHDDTISVTRDGDQIVFTVTIKCKQKVS